MRRRFVPLPYEALALCANEREEICILRLYRKAHSHGWAALRMSTRDFGEPGALRQEVVLRLLGELEADGLIEWTRGTRTTPGKIRVLNPVGVEEGGADHRGGSSADHLPDHTEEPPVQSDDTERTTARTTDGTPARTTPHAHEDTGAQNQTRPDQSTPCIPTAVAVGVVARPPDPLPAIPDPPDPTPSRDHDGAPGWAVKAPRPKGVTPLALAGAVCRAVSAITGRPAQPQGSATNAKPVLALWRALDRPPPDDFASDLVLVAEAAKDCPAPMFARDIRAEGWADGTDRSRSVPAVCRQAPPTGSSGATWEERLAEARRWDAAGRPSTWTEARSRERPVLHASPPAFESLADKARRVFGDDPPAPHPDDVSIFDHPMPEAS